MKSGISGGKKNVRWAAFRNQANRWKGGKRWQNENKRRWKLTMLAIVLSFLALISGFSSQYYFLVSPFRSRNTRRKNGWWKTSRKIDGTFTDGQQSFPFSRKTNWLKFDFFFLFCSIVFYLLPVRGSVRPRQSCESLDFSFYNMEARMMEK